MHSTRLNAHSASPGANRAVIHAIDKDIPALDAGECLVPIFILSDPFLEKRPIVVSIFDLTPAAVAVLEKADSALQGHS